MATVNVDVFAHKLEVESHRAVAFSPAFLLQFATVSDNMEGESKTQKRFNNGLSCFTAWSPNDMPQA